MPDMNGTMIPFGIMNSEQAAELPDDYEVLIAHPAGDQNNLPVDPQADTPI